MCTARRLCSIASKTVGLIEGLLSNIHTPQVMSWRQGLQFAGAHCLRDMAGRRGRAHGVLAWYVHWRIQCVRARRSQRSNSHFARCMIPLPGGTLLRFDLFSLCRVSEDLFSLCRVSVGFDLFSRASVSQYKCRIDKRTCAFNL